MTMPKRQVLTERYPQFMRVWIIAVLVGLSSHVAIAQTTVSFKARVSSTTVSLEDNFQIFYTLENATAEDFSPPKFNDFEVLSGPNYSSNVTFTDGKVFKREEYSFILRPLKKGTFKIGAATIKTSNKRIKSNTLTIRVVGEKKAPKYEPEELFVKIELSADSVFLGQQLTLNYKVYTKVNVERYSFEKEPAYEGFYAEELDRFFSPTATETINGDSYTTKIIRRLALFPLKTGEHQIEEAEINFIVSESRGFLFRRNVKNIRKNTEALSVTVLPLPDGAPATFSGAVGNFSFDTRISTTRLKVGEGTSLIYVITGNGDPKRVQPPIIPSSDTFEFYKPTIINEKVESSTKGEFLQQIQVEYLLIPKLPGNFLIRPEFSYFDPDSNKYITAKTEPVSLTVAPSSLALSPNEKNESKKVLILPLKTAGQLKTKNHIFFNSPAFWALLCLPPVLLFVLYAKETIILARPGHTGENQESLEDLLDLVDRAVNSAEENISGSFSVISKVFRWFLIWKFKLPAGFSKTTLKTRLKNTLPDKKLSDKVVSLFEEVEYAVYSPVKKKEQLLKIASEVKRIMREIA